MPSPGTKSRSERETLLAVLWAEGCNRARGRAITFELGGSFSNRVHRLADSPERIYSRHVRDSLPTPLRVGRPNLPDTSGAACATQISFRNRPSREPSSGGNRAEHMPLKNYAEATDEV